jgi:hypothetical protein
MEAFDAELWGNGLALDVTIDKRETLQEHAVKTVEVFSGSQAAIQPTAHLEPGPRRRLARRINSRAWNCHSHGITTMVHMILGHSGILGNEDANHHVNLASDQSGGVVIMRPYTAASNRV